MLRIWKYAQYYSPNILANVDSLIAKRSIQSSLRQCIRIQRMPNYQTVATLLSPSIDVPPSFRLLQQRVYIIYIHI